MRIREICEAQLFQLFQEILHPLAIIQARQKLKRDKNGVPILFKRKT